MLIPRAIMSVFCFVTIFYNSIGQEKLYQFPFELDCSINRTFFDKDANSGRIGFGIGLIQEFRPEESLSILFGFGYSQTSIFKEYIYEGNLSYSTDVTLIANNISFTIGPRFKTGRHSNFYFEGGFFADLVIGSKMKGERLSCSVDNDSLVCRSYQIDENAKLYNACGFNMGAGLIIPVSNNEILIGLDYRLGLNLLLDFSDNTYKRYLRLKLGFRFD